MEIWPQKESSRGISMLKPVYRVCAPVSCSGLAQIQPQQCLSALTWRLWAISDTRSQPDPLSSDKKSHKSNICSIWLLSPPTYTTYCVSIILAQQEMDGFLVYTYIKTNTTLYVDYIYMDTSANIWCKKTSSRRKKTCTMRTRLSCGAALTRFLDEWRTVNVIPLVYTWSNDTSNYVIYFWWSRTCAGRWRT